MSFCLEHTLNWLYIDINSYFATIEQQVNPKLRNIPIVVVPLDTDSTSAIAVSQEAKSLGIKTGTKIYEAKKLCPELICIKARHNIYREYHDKIFQEIDKYLQVDHIFSIDEGACKLTDKYQNAVQAISLANLIKNKLKENVGDYITCSIGIAPNRYLAKIASNIQKPDGLVVINPNELPNKLYNLSLRDMPGIGMRTHNRLLQHNISSIKQLCSVDINRLKIAWGSITGQKIWYLIRGANLAVEQTKSKTLSHSQVLAPSDRNPNKSKEILIILVMRAAGRLRAKDLFTKTIQLTIDTVHNKPNALKATSKITLSNDSNYLLKQVLGLWDKLIKNNQGIIIKKIGIFFSNLQHQTKQLSFEDLTTQKSNTSLSKAIDQLNNKYGNNTISIGTLPTKDN